MCTAAMIHRVKELMDTPKKGHGLTLDGTLPRYVSTTALGQRALAAGVGSRDIQITAQSFKQRYVKAVNQRCHQSRPSWLIGRADGCTP